jgi:tRNA A37 threonylcarbamoyladenosine dehydratase
MNKHYFNSIEEAEKFIKANNIKDYHFQTPEYLENGVDLVIHKTFICEICGEETSIECEGSEPKTCAECMPINIEESGDDNGYN